MIGCMCSSMFAVGLDGSWTCEATVHVTTSTEVNHLGRHTSVCCQKIYSAGPTVYALQLDLLSFFLIKTIWLFGCNLQSRNPRM